MIPSQMLKGVLQGSVLAILGQRETYGYEIVQALHGYGFGSVSEGRSIPFCSDWRRRDGFPPGLWTRTWDRGGNTIPLPTKAGGSWRSSGPVSGR